MLAELYRMVNSRGSFFADSVDRGLCGSVSSTKIKTPSNFIALHIRVCVSGNRETNEYKAISITA